MSARCARYTWIPILQSSQVMVVSSGFAQVSAHIHSAWTKKKTFLKILNFLISSSQWDPSRLAREWQPSYSRDQEVQPRMQLGLVSLGTDLQPGLPGNKKSKTTVI